MTNFSWFDGSVVGFYLLATMVAGVMVRKYVGKVEHFLVAGREMNVYLGIASLAATEFGIVTCMYTAQNGYEMGFAGAVPGMLQFVAMLLIGWTGFCIKPLRDSGVITIPELLEKRFGQRVRWAAGVVIVLGGLLNMGVFLRVGGEFLLSVCGMDQLSFGSEFLNQHKIEVMMTVLLAAVAVYTIMGGMLSVLVTDFLQFVVMSAGLIVVTILILTNIGWDKLVETVQIHHGAGGFNPLVHPKMGWPYVVFNSMLNTAAVLTWQTTIARVLAAKDTATGRKVYTGTSFFFVCRFLIPAVWGIAALSMLGWQPLKQLTREELEQIPPAIQYKIEQSALGRPLATVKPEELAKMTAEQRRKALTEEELKAIPALVQNKLNGLTLQAMPLFLCTFVPIGLMGLLIAAMLAADMSTDSSYMLTWSSVIYNDILAPFRKTQWSEKRGLRWNRMIVALIGVFLLFYGLWYPLKGDLWTYLGVTGTIYLASMSSLLIACCYWKRANNWGAAAAIVVGAVIPSGFLVMEQLPATKDVAKQIGPYYSGIAAYLLTGVAMVVGSLLKPQAKPA